MTLQADYDPKILKPHGKTERKTRSYLLDTLEVTSEFPLTDSRKTLYVRGLQKHTTNVKLIHLVDVCNNSAWAKKYWKTWHCSNVYLQEGEHLKGSLCRKRWCQHCNRIKTAEMVNGYGDSLRSLGQLYLVTLTAPTVDGRELRSQIKKRIKTFKRIKDTIRKRGLSFNGFRKLEITFSKGKFHPHFHIIVSGKAQAETLLTLWMKQNPRSKIVGQDIRPIGQTDKDFIECFTYATKGGVKDETEARALHTIYRALEGFRAFQPYGQVRKAQITPETGTEAFKVDWCAPCSEIWLFDQDQSDWTASNGKTLVGTQTITEALKQQTPNNE